RAHLPRMQILLAQAEVAEGSRDALGIVHRLSVKRRHRSHCGGPLPRWTRTVCVPAPSRYRTAIVAPGFFVSRIALTADAARTVRPATAVITSPLVSPAVAAGPPATTPAINAPPSVSATWTPRNAVAPTW